MSYYVLKLQQPIVRLNAFLFLLILHLGAFAQKTSFIKVSSNSFLLQDLIGNCYLTDSGKTHISKALVSIKYIEEEMFLVRRDTIDTCFYLMDNHGIIFPEKVQAAFYYKNGFTRVVGSNDLTKYAYFNKRGTRISNWYDREVNLIVHMGGRSSVLKDIMSTVVGTFTFGIVGREIRNEGGGHYKEKSLIEPLTNHKYFYGGDFEKGIAVVSVKRKQNSNESNISGKEEFVSFGAIDTTGKVIIPCIFKQIENYKNGLLRVKKDDVYGLFNNKAKTILNIEWNNLEPIYHYKPVYRFDLEVPDYWKSDSLYENPFYFSVGKNLISNALVKVKNDSVSFLTKFNYWEIDFGGESTFMVRDGSQYGFIDINGKLIVPLNYRFVKRFIKGKAKVCYDIFNDCFYINLKGERLE
ncbi:MAG: WG repeat-containing protein [Bacteroidetes bacterium]|nr:WG repeat-containing protein [Bacteroidota bacterium]